MKALQLRISGTKMLLTVEAKKSEGLSVNKSVAISIREPVLSTAREMAY